MVKKFCLEQAVLIDECKNQKCPLAPCSFGMFVDALSTLFKGKDFSKKHSIKMGRKIVLDCFLNKSNNNLENLNEI